MKPTNDENISQGALSVGIDIGTTTISTVVYDNVAQKEVESFSCMHNSYVSSGVFSEESVKIILDTAKGLLYQILDTYSGIASIGITGQMHGIVYADKEGEPISELITWQDKRADETLPSGKTAICEIYELTGEKISAGYGIATHYYNMKMGLVPKNAVCFLSIMDIFAMEICKTKKTATHATVGASFGLFDNARGEFMYDKIARLGIDKSILPIVTSENEVVGHCRGIPVSVPIGDNQASFLGATKSNNDALLVNFGTGSQISSACDFCTVDGDIELRPYVDGKYLLVGSALSGGYSYSLLEAFFRSYAQALGASGAQYEIMNELAAQAYEKGEKELLVDTAFLGKRSDPSARGSVKMIGKDNFTPSALILGVLRGMVSELYGLYARFPKKQGVLVASGGAVKKNELLRRIIEDTFQMSLTVSDVNEDAACGAAIFSLQNKNTI